MTKLGHLLTLRMRSGDYKNGDYKNGGYNSCEAPCDMAISP
jgi:hypothetical protein